MAFERLTSLLVAFFTVLPLGATASAATIKFIARASVAVMGEIVKGDAAQSATALNECKRTGCGEINVFLSSGGGLISEALEVAEEINKAAANTVVGENDTCASACSLMFLAGKTRAVYPGARVGVHSAMNDELGGENLETLGLSAWVARKYEELGAPPTVIAKCITTRPNQIYWLTEDDLRAMNVLFLSTSSGQTGRSPEPGIVLIPPAVPPVQQPILPTTPLRKRFSVEGLAVGAAVAPSSAAYNEYSCKPSKQYPQFTWCFSEKSEGEIITRRTIVHSAEGIVAYVNKGVSPAFFKDSEVDAEISRLSKLFGSSPHRYRLPERPGYPKAVIAVWGAIELRQLPYKEAALLAQGEGSGRGILVDFLTDFQRSAQVGLPVYSLAGGAGSVWLANYDELGRGALRFFAADPSLMKVAAPSALSTR
jgi:hypothetical protein